MENALLIVGIVVVMVILTIIGILTRFRKCPSDQILVIYGKTSNGKSAKCIHGGAAFIWPIIQGYKYMSLQPLQFDCKLEKALSSQNIRVDVPTTITVGISTDPIIMQAAAERLLSLNLSQIEDLVKDIVYGQMRLIVSNMTIEKLNSERDEFLDQVRQVVGTELNKVGLNLINVNITDIRDEAGYIVALGQKDKAIALNKAKVEIASAERDGATQQAELVKDQNTKVAATKRDESVAVAKANADKDSQVAEAQKERDISIAKAQADSAIGQFEAEQTVVNKNAELEVAKAEADQKARTAQVKADAEVKKERELANIQVVRAEAQVQQEQEKALTDAENARAVRNKAALTASTIVPAEAAKEEARIKAEAIKIATEVKAAAEANQAKIKAEGEAEAEARRGEGAAKAISSKGLAEAEVIRQKGLAEAEAQKAALEAQAEGFRKMIEAAEANPQVAIQFKMVEEGTYERMAKEQAEAFKHMQFGNIQIMDTSKGSGLTETMSRLISEIAPVLNITKSIPGMPKALAKKVVSTEKDVEFPSIE